MRAPLLATLVTLLLAGCAMESLNGGHPDSNPTGGDANPGCPAFVTFDPPTAIAGPDTTVRAIANAVPGGGVATYSWTVFDPGHDPVAFANAQPDGSQIEFAVPTPGAYDVSLNVSLSTGGFCNVVPASLNVGTGSANASYRLRVSAPPAPPQERTLIFAGGVASYAFGTFALDPGVAVAGEVHGAGGVKVPAYLRFIPRGRPDQIVEAFTTATGAFSGVQLVGETHDVLVIPTSAGYAPWLATSFDPTSTVISIGTGATATGSVRGPGGAGLAGARVQLAVDGVPSTIATTTATGAFSLLYEPSTRVGAVVALEVTPPAGSGLPRLTAASTAIAPGAPLAVTYASALVVRDLAGTKITRGGSPLASPHVTIAGTVAAAGSLNGAVALAGDLHASADADATGTLPTLKAPNAPLSAVVATSATDLAVVAIDLSTAAPATIAAPAPASVATLLLAPGGPVPGGRVVAQPIGDLALAGAQPVAATADAGGTATLVLAPGGHYDVRLADPRGLAALTTLPDLTSATVPATAHLGAAVQVTGKVTQAGGANPVAGAAIQVLCKTCNGLDRTRPLAEAASDASGAFVLGVPDLPP